MYQNYGYDDSYDEYSFPPRHNAYDDYDEDVYEMYFTDDDYLDMMDTCSSSDCTGLMVSGTGDCKELDQYKKLYRFGSDVHRDKEDGSMEM